MVRKQKTPSENAKTMKGHTMQWAIATLASSTLLNLGLQSGWVSPMAKILQSSLSPTGPLSDNVMSWIASSHCISAMICVPIYSYVADTYGRKVGIIAISILQALCWTIKLFAKSTLSLLIARIICGIAAGGCFNIIPMYTKEISQDDLRGALGTLVMLAQNIGIFTIYALGAYLDYYTVIWVAISLPILATVLMLKAPESPAFLMKMGKVEAAASTIAFLRGLDISDKTVQNEIDYLRNEDISYKSMPDVSLTSILKNKAWRRGFTMALMMLGVQSFNGTMSITMYAATILSKSGMNLRPETQSLIVPVVMIIGSFVSMYCVEKLGRKPLLVIMLALTGASLAGLASMLLAQQWGSAVPGWLPVASVAMAVFAFAAGVLPAPYVIMMEVFNFQIRGKLIGCLVTYAWFIAFVQVAIFSPISNAFGTYTTFFCFAAINFLGVFMTLVFIPETKGKSIEEIEQELSN